MKRTVSLLLLSCVVSCRDVDVVTGSYNNLSEARTAGAVASGRMPEGLPPGATDLREAFDADTPARWGLFSFPVAEAPYLERLLKPLEWPLAGERCNPPRRIEWWPIVLRGELDAERIAAAGLKAYKTRDDALILVINWNQGRAYYWSPGR